MTALIVVLASGSGTNCQALLDACDDGTLDARIAAVITNNPQAGVIARAEAAGAPVAVVDHTGSDPERRRAADQALVDTIARFDPDLVVLAGWMRILGDALGARFAIINLHPALPGMFAGTNAIARAYAAWQKDEIDESGVMIHWVPDSGVDVGPVVLTEPLGFAAGEALESFETRMHALEHRLIVRGARMALGELGIDAG